MYRETLTFDTPGKGLHEITADVSECLDRSEIEDGVLHLFLLHTSASLVIQENADPSARRDLAAYFERIAPEGDPSYTHTSEGPDDMPSHLRAALTHTSETILVDQGRMVLGTWQGIYLFEHRRQPHRRRVAVRIIGD